MKCLVVVVVVVVVAVRYTAWGPSPDTANFDLCVSSASSTSTANSSAHLLPSSLASGDGVAAGGRRAS